MIKDHKKISNDLKKITSGINSLYQTLNNILQRPDMGLAVTVEKEEFVLNPATTHEEFEKLAVLRDKLIKLLLTEHTKAYINSSAHTADIDIDNEFKPILEFGRLKDPKEYQVEKKHKIKACAPKKDKFGNVVKSIALDLDSYQVQVQTKGEYVKID